MTATVEHIKKEISHLAPDEAKELFLELQRDFLTTAQDNPEDSAASIEAEWDAEIDARVKEVESGTVELISGKSFMRHVDQLFAQKGLTRSRQA